MRKPPLAVVAALAWIAALAVAEVSPAQPPDCGECHDVESDPVSSSPHGGLDCADCHSGFDEDLHPEELSPPECADCHPDTVEELSGSVHGQRLELSEPGTAARCAVCHGGVHELVPADDPASPVRALRLPETCGSCHADPQMAERLGIRLVQPKEAYLASVHAGSVREGGGGATCSDCHGAHAIFPAADARSQVHRSAVPQTCGQCHAQITETYSRSVHGLAASHGIRESPVCTDCHGEHRILSPDAKSSPVYATNIPKVTCGRCHGDLRLTEKFGLETDKVPSYADSYHGLAARSGSVTVAHCGSCHGIHDILPSSDPESHTHPDRLGATCGKCHPGAGERFSIGPVHVEASTQEHPGVYWVRLIYVWMIALVIGGMLVHNGADLYRKGRQPGLRTPAPRGRGRERMSRPFRLAHGAFALSFLVLVYTGFALKYPESWWAAPVLQWEDQFGFRGWLHRAAAVVMLAASVFHVAHLAVSRRARRCIAAMRPGREDLRELRERLRFFLGRRPDPPHSPWVGYQEKMEYLAVVWGTVVMTLTGFFLWLETPVLRYLPKWTIDVATAIHFYEAVLAGLAILVWHFYAVIFDPVVYPMDPAWLSGRSAPGRAAERRDDGASDRIAGDG